MHYKMDITSACDVVPIRTDLEACVYSPLDSQEVGKGDARALFFLSSGE